VRWRDRRSGQEIEKPIRSVFIFIGADPATGWLQDCGVALDAKGFVLTGTNIPPDQLRSSNGTDRPQSLETNVPGVFAVGDVRAGSVKRVGAAIGEGATVVPQIHTLLENITAASAMQPLSAAA
jgi:thioredoxin reductase (NADPH)